MFKALFKKQFAELNAFYFFDKKTGKLRSKKQVVGICALYLILFLVLGFMFGMIGTSVAGVLVPVGLDWLYFALIGLIAIALGVFGSVFNTYAGLYQAKDNELLLSMPVRPMVILIVRVCGVCLMSLLYTAIAWIPACAAYFVFAPVTARALIFSLLLTVVITCFVSVLTCALGWVVALLSAKLKNKSYITVLLSLLFIAGYYYVYFRFNELLQNFILNSEKVESAMRTWGFPLYMLGRAATGETMPMLIFTAFTAALCALCLFILARGFIRIVTTSSSGKKAVYREKQAVRISPARALLGREARRFTSSATYMLNCGLGLVILPVLAVFALIKAEELRAVLEAFAAGSPQVARIPPVAAVAAMLMVLSMNYISAPSVSLEGKNLWIVQSLPVSGRDVLLAKERFHVLLNAPPAAVTAVVLAVVLRADVLTALMMLVVCGVYIFFTADFGLWLNLKHPSLEWTSETVPVKQGFAPSVVIFSGWGVALVVGALGFALASLPCFVTLAIVAVALGAVTLLLRRLIFTRGVEIFETL